MEATFDTLLKDLSKAADVVNKFSGEAAKAEVARSIIEFLTGAVSTHVARSPVMTAPSHQSTATKSATRAKPPASVVRAGKRYQELQIVDDLDLRPKGKTSLREFLEAKAPRTNEERYAVIVYYLKRVAEIGQVTLDHVYTSLKEAGQRVSGDLAARLRDTERRKGWINPSDTHDIRLTQNGENFVEHDLSGEQKTKVA